MLDINNKLLLNKNIILRSINNKYWALNVINGNQYKLNETSYFILELFREPKYMYEVINIMIKTYDVDYRRLEEDCVKLMFFAVEQNILNKES